MNKSEVDIKKIEVINLFFNKAQDELGYEGLIEVLAKVDGISVVSFDWDKIPGDDEQKLKELLSSNHKMEWAEDAQIEKKKSDDKIIVRNDGNSAEIKIDNDSKMATLETGGKVICKMDIKMDANNNQIIYEDSKVLIDIINEVKETREKQDLGWD